MTKQKKYRALLAFNKKQVHLGFHDCEKTAAIHYNDHASYLNQTQNTKYPINEIDDYTPNPRDVNQEFSKK